MKQANNNEEHLRALHVSALQERVGALEANIDAAKSSLAETNSAIQITKDRIANANSGDIETTLAEATTAQNQVLARLERHRRYEHGLVTAMDPDAAENRSNYMLEALATARERIGLCVESLERRCRAVETAQAQLDSVNRDRASLEELKSIVVEKTKEIKERVEQKGEFTQYLEIVAGGPGEALLWVKQVAGLLREAEQ